jgi:hypothetical protein
MVDGGWYVIAAAAATPGNTGTDIFNQMSQRNLCIENSLLQRLKNNRVFRATVVDGGWWMVGGGCYYSCSC